MDFVCDHFSTILTHGGQCSASNIAIDTGLGISHLDQDEVLLDLPVEGESTHGGDGLVSQVVVSGSIVLHQLK
jgi:hypothetical protein